MWDEFAIARLRVLWNAEGLSAAEIGRRLGITNNAVIGKARRLNLTARPSPIPGRTTGDRPLMPRPPRPPRVPKVTLAPIATPEPLAIVPRVKSRPLVQTLPAVPVEAAPVIGKVRGAAFCCWPVSDGRPWRFCDAPVERVGSYCGIHHAMARGRAVPAAEAGHG